MYFPEPSSIESTSLVKYNERETSGFCGLPCGVGEETLLVAMAFMFNVPDILSCQTKHALHQKFKIFFRVYINRPDFKYVTFDKVVYSLSEQSKVLPRQTLEQWEQHDYDFSLKERSFGFFSMNKDDPSCLITWMITQHELDTYLPPDFEHYDQEWDLAYF